MTYEEYCTKGYYYRDYIKLSQWQRYRAFRRYTKERKLQGPQLFWLGLNSKRWRYGFDTGQTWEEFGFGFFMIVWMVK